MKRLIEISKFQSSFDMQKYYDSHNNGRNTCGEYAFCKFCEKSGENDCGKAFYAMKDFEAKNEKSKTK